MISDITRERIQLYKNQGAIIVGDYNLLLQEVLKSYDRRAYIISDNQKIRESIWGRVKRDVTTIHPNMIGYLRTGQQIRVMSDNVEFLLGLSPKDMVVLLYG